MGHNCKLYKTKIKLDVTWQFFSKNTVDMRNRLLACDKCWFAKFLQMRSDTISARWLLCRKDVCCMTLIWARLMIWSSFDNLRGLLKNVVNFFSPIGPEFMVFAFLRLHAFQRQRTNIYYDARDIAIVKSRMNESVIPFLPTIVHLLQSAKNNGTRFINPNLIWFNIKTINNVDLNILKLFQIS